MCNECCEAAVTKPPSGGEVADRQAWYEAEIAKAERQWIDGFHARYEAGDDVPSMSHFVALWLAERTAPPSAPAGVEAAILPSATSAVTGSASPEMQRPSVAAVDDVLAEEANERAAIAAYEKYMGVSADDPAYGPDLTQWMAGWNAALAQQPAAVDGWHLEIYRSEMDNEPAVWAVKNGSRIWVADIAAKPGGNANE